MSRQSVAEYSFLEFRRFSLQSTTLAPYKVVLSRVVLSVEVSGMVYPIVRSWRIPKGGKWHLIAQPTMLAVGSRRSLLYLLVYLHNRTCFESLRTKVIVVIKQDGV